ncbi:Testis-specific gene 10 protein [Camelus dromedarius]|uniref:Testis-specific gene 10 protein n=1 Tax=Camelus dromedarius TaxID=9838 RepID=A0A5N4CD25_CAMDR|nr:Testis-specific gene 10 protein [Camelus dromedarius]
MSSGEDDRPRTPGRDPQLQVTTKEHDFGLGAPVSEAEKYQNILQLEQEVRNQDKLISTLKLQIEDLKQTNHGLEEYARKLLDSKEVVSSQVDDLTSHNEHLCQELIKIDQLAEQLEKEKNFVVDTADKELEEAKIEHICQQNNIIVLEDTIKRLRSIILETEKAQNKSPSRLDSFVKTLEADRDHYKSEAQKLRKMIRSRSKSPRRPSPSTRGTNCDVELLKTTRDREELKCMLEKYERHLAEIQGNVKVLTSERDKTFLLYEQAQEEIARLRREMMKSCKSPKSTTAHAILRRVETERDVAFTDLRRMTTERDSLRERLKIAQETAFNEKAHLEQRIEELECTVHNVKKNHFCTFGYKLWYLDDERMEQMSNMTLMKETITTVEKEMKSLARKAMDTESELGRQKAENNSLRLLYENTEKDLSDTQRHLAKKKYELQLTQEKIMCLDEKIDNFTRQSIAQREEISILGATLNDLAKEKECLQACLDKKSENIASLGESLAMKEKTISGMKNIIAEMEQASRMRRQLDETNDELAQIARERDILAHENDSLQEQFSKAKQENQALSKKLNDTHNELSDIKQKVQDTNLEVNKLKNILKSEESENRQMMDQLRKANEDAENWENKARQAEADNNTLKLELITAEAEGNRLKEKVDSLTRELEQHLNAERSYKSQISTLHKSIVKMEEELQKVQFEKVSALADLSSTRELCIKLDSSKELLNRQLVAKDQEIEMMENELDSARSEIELLRSQMTNERISMQNLEALLVANRDKEYQSQIALQEKESEIQLLKEHLCLAENKMAIQSRDVAQFRNVVTQLEADLDITKRQLGTERFERERAVQELRRQNYSSNAYHLSSAMKPNAKCHSPERVHHRSPDRGLDRSLEE